MLHALLRGLAGLTATAALLVAANANAAPVAVKSGQEMQLLNVALWRGPFCTPPKIVMKVVQPPKHGTLQEKRATLDPAKATGGDDYFTQCHGKAMPSLVYTYRPNAGFTGKDRIVLRMLAAEDGSGSYHYDISVD